MSEPAHQILKDARKEAGLTQIQVAALLSVSVEQVKRMERGDWIPEMADVDMMEEQLRDVGLFRRWARAQWRLGQSCVQWASGLVFAGLLR